MALPLTHLKGRGVLKTKGRARTGFPFLELVLSHALVGILCLYLGYGIGIGRMGDSRAMSSDCAETETIQESTTDVVTTTERMRMAIESKVASARSSPFPHTVSKLFVDYATIPREIFNEKLDIGVPYDDNEPGAEDVLLLYTSRNSLPNDMGISDEKFKLDPDTAMENCHTVKVILQPATRVRQTTNQCVAIVPQWESYVVHKFMRIEHAAGEADLGQPLIYVPRSQEERGGFEGIPLLEKHTLPSYQALVQYLQNHDRIIGELKTFFRGVLQTSPNKRSRTLVVLTCNKGQSMLFRNFVCNARAKGLDISQVVLFATDEYTLKLSQDLGIPAWYDESIFGGMPEQSANRYGDMIFGRMMMAKVYCVHLALVSGYNVLFQDVDVVWYQNPLPFVESDKFSNYDMVFQDDGSRQVRFAPYSPNSGMYFISVCTSVIQVRESHDS